MITLRLNRYLEKAIANTAKLTGLSKSELVRKSILEYLEKLQSKSPWETGKDLFGKYSSGRHDLSEHAGSLFRQKLKAKRK